MNDQNVKVLTNIIGAVESGGQVYGKRDYARYTPPYKNTPEEHTITLGWYQAYGHEARKLVQAIFNADTAAFWKLDTAGIEEMLTYDWEGIKWNPTAKQKAVLIALIDSAVGHEMQDKLFAEKVPQVLADCSHDFTDDIKAQMMYFEIRHLGGRVAVNRIFRRCNNKYDLDTIMASLVVDQKSDNKNLVGSQKFWSRHLKCKEFIERYAVDENEAKEEPKYMGVIVGSARGDEYGNATGGKAGDQKQTSTSDYKGEVSMQSYYVHSKGWVLIRAKDPKAREMIAKDMEYACANKLIGYDQSQNRTLYDVVKPLGFDCSKVKTACETDCAQLVRVCVRYAGIDCGDFYTVTEKDVLQKTGKFDIYTSAKYCKSSDYLLRGDILVTKTKGHTVVVLSNGSKSGEAEVAPGTPNLGVVAKYQNFLNVNYPAQVKASVGSLLAVDNDYGKKTRAASVAVWKYMANKYYGASLTISNPNFLTMCKEVAAKMTQAEVAKHPTLGYIIQGVLAGLKFYTANLDGVCGAKTKATIKEFQKKCKLKETGEMNADTWYKLFNY